MHKVRRTKEHVGYVIQQTPKISSDYQFEEKEVLKENNEFEEFDSSSDEESPTMTDEID